MKFIDAVKSGWNDWRGALRVRVLTGRAESAESRIKVLEEELELERVKNRIQQEEINELALVIARNHQRVKREIEDLGGPVTKPETQVLNVAG